MRILNSVGSIIVFSVFLNQAAAQVSPSALTAGKTPEQLELEKKAVVIVEQIVDETSFLKLPENRALIAASAGDLIWRRDEKRARQLFRQAAQEVIQANNSLVIDNSPAAMIGFLTNASPRKQILLTIAKYDPELALELLYATRPPDVVAALSERNQGLINVGEKEKMTPDSMITNSKNKFLADSELRLEQSFASRAVEKDPERAAKLFRESLAKNGVTNAAFEVLDKINAADDKLGAALAAEVGGKLLDSDFAKQETERRLVNSFLRRYYLDSKSGPVKDTARPIRIDDRLAKNLANKLADYFLRPEKGKNLQENMEGAFEIGQSISVLERIIPERVALLKQKQNEFKKSVPEEFAMFDDEDFGSDSGGEQEKIGISISSATKMPAEMRGGIYRAAIDQAVTEEELGEARESLRNAPESKARDDALAYLDSKFAESKINSGAYDEARKMIDRLPSNREKVARLVQLAIIFNEKNTDENREFAEKLIDEARNLIEIPPQDEDGINNYLNVAAGFANIRPEAAFTMLSLFADQVNDIANASALLAKYDKRERSFRNGELILMRGLPRIGNKVFEYGKEINLLAHADLDRLLAVTDRFQRLDVRVLLKLYIVQAFFDEKIGLEGGNELGTLDDFADLFFSN